jgi:hypothetical protein
MIRIVTCSILHFFLFLIKPFRLPAIKEPVKRDDHLLMKKQYLKLIIMKKKVFYSIAAILVSGLFVFTSCDNLKENELSVNDLEIEEAEDDAMAEDVYSTIDAMIDDEIATLDANNYNSDNGFKSGDDELYVCKEITVDHPNDTTYFPKVVTIDYGEGFTVIINGEEYTRKGMIKITVTERWFIEGASRTTTFIDFYMNDVKVEGTRTLTNIGANDDGNLEFSHELVDGKLTFFDSLEYTRTSSGVREWERAATPIDDKWYITGSRNGINAEGSAYEHTIIEELVLVRCEEFRYQWAIVQGVVEVTRNGKTAIIDYGNGTCDGAAVLEVNGEQREFQVRKRYNHRRKIFRMRN